MLNQSFLNHLEQLIGTSAHIRETLQCRAELFQVQVAVQPFVEELAFDGFPEFVVLDLHVASCFDELSQCESAISI